MLSDLQLKNVCLAYNTDSSRCRYLCQDDNNWNQYYCLKKCSKKAEIDVEIADFIEETRKKNKDPYKENIPLGNNCSGYPIMKYIQQGYDVT